MTKIICSAVSVIGFVLNSALATANLLEAIKLNGGLFLGALFYSPKHLLGVLLPLSIAGGIIVGLSIYYSVVYTPEVGKKSVFEEILS